MTDDPYGMPQTDEQDRGDGHIGSRSHLGSEQKQHVRPLASGS